MKNCQEYFDYLQPAMFGKYEKREGREKPDLNPLTEKKNS
jgi:hypothetical protein